MRRRDFLRASTLTAAAGLFPGAIRGAFAEELLRPLRGGAGIFTGRQGGTIGWWIGDGGALVIDTQFPDAAKSCLSALRGKTARKLDAVLITHHHGDHTAGIGTFRPEAAKVVAQTNVPALQKARAETQGNLDAQDYPETLFESETAIELPGEVARGRHEGPGHTGGDAVWHLERANVVHMGDLVFHSMVPFIDRPGGASIAGWISVLEKAMARYPKDALYVYGHASKGNEVFGAQGPLGGMRDYLSGLLEYVKKGKAAGNSLDELSKVERIPGFSEVVPAWEGALKGNVEAAWEELGG